MKILFGLIYFNLLFSVFAQSTTYSKYEERMINYANNGWAYASKYDSLSFAQTSLDSCWRFIKKYPYSFAKPNVLSYMLEMSAILNKNPQATLQIMDSVLTYDRLPSTKLRIGEILIERNIDVHLGRDFVLNTLPELTVPYHKYRAYRILARSDVSLGYYSSAKTNYDNALILEPDRLSFLYEYLSFLKMSELSTSTNLIETKIKEIEENEKQQYFENSTSGQNINKSVQDIELKDLDGELVKFSDYEGKVILINEFNFWCGWCIKEFPTLKNIIKEFPNVEYVFVNSGEKPEELKDYYFRKPEFSFLNNHRVVFTSQLYKDTIYGYSVPHTLIVDKKGRIRFDFVGYKDNLESLLKKNLRKLLNE